MTAHFDPSSPTPKDISTLDDNEINLTKLLRSIWRGKLLIMFCATIAAFLGGYYAFGVATPVFQANAVIALESRQEQVVDLESVVSGLGADQIAINTEVEVLKSRGLLEKLVVELDLTSDPEFNSALNPDPGFSPGQVIVFFRDLITGPPPEPEPMTEREVLDAAIDAMLRKMSISNIRQSYVFRIAVVTESPRKSALIANTLADLYILNQLETKFEATEKATTWLTDRVGQLQIELESAEAAVKDFNANAELVSPEALAGLNRQIKELRDRLQDATQARALAQKRIDMLTAARDSGDMERMEAVASDSALTRIHNQIKANSATDQTLFQNRFETILDRANLDRSRAQNQIDALTTTIADQRAQIERQSEDLGILLQLQREAEASKLIYEYFLARLKETSVQQGIQKADSRLLSSAVEPLRPSAPRKSMIVALSFILGAIAGIALILLREFSQKTFRAAEDLEARTGYTVLGQIPAISARRRKNVLKYLQDKPTSGAAEAIRNLRTSILLSNVDNPPQIIMSTSSVPGEGKTTQSLALAQNLSGLGKKVLLIEGDIRRRVFSEYFDIKERRGMISVLSGDRSLEQAVVHEKTMNVDILIGEKTGTNAADLFSSSRFTKFLEDLRNQYDYVIIDTPPVLAVPDARVIGQSVDAIVYTVKWDNTTHRQVSEGLKSFETVNIKVTGLVLGQISSKGMKGYGYGDSYGSYSSYYDN